VRPVALPSGIGPLGGFLAVADGALLVAGETRAAYYDDRSWQLIFDASKLR
jgi:hypothetical protein